MPPSEPSAVNASRKTIRQLEMDALVGYILLYGVLLSLVLILGGMFWRWLNTGTLWLDYQLAGMNLFQLVVEELRLAIHGDFRPRLLISLGIVVLMLTPFLRVLASVFFFLAVMKNWKYTLFTSIVLVVLTYSLFLR
jgi:uncharacterized membrane protein